MRSMHARSFAPVGMCALLLASTLVTVGRASARVSGVVVDSSLQPVHGALVSVRASAERTTTTADGRFAFPALAGSELVIVGARKGYFNASSVVTSPASNVMLFLFPVPQSDDPGYELVDPATCGSCHPDQLDEWAGSPMSKSGTNTWVHDTFDGSGTPGGMGGFVYVRDSAFALGNPASECASCHQPETWIAAPFTAMTALANPTPQVLHGVSCDVCHKIADVDEGKINAPGIYPGAVTFTRPSGVSQVQYGLLGDVDFAAPGLMRASYQPQLEAAVCAACHQDKNDPDQDGDFDEPDGIISEPTYLEWLASPFGDASDPRYANCLDCHMPRADARTICTERPVLRPAGSTRSHRIEGTTPAFLDNAVELAFDSARLASGTLEVDVRITNSGTGHHVPTGVTIRNMILLVEAWRRDDGTPLTSTGTQTVHALGGVGDPTQGYYAELPGKLFAKVIHDAAGRWPTFFTDASGMVFDNRIPALASDVSSYRFAVRPGDATLDVRARLVYRRSFRALTDAKQWTHDGHGAPLEDLVPPHFGHLMETAAVELFAVDCAGRASGTSCSDGNVCNGNEVCDGAGVCVPGTPLACDDGNPCTSDRCDLAAGCRHVATAGPCDDGDACTTGDACIDAVCAGGTVQCDDGNLCTADACDALTGCTHDDVTAPCDDGDACTTGDSCRAGLCVAATVLDCDDGDACTQDECRADSGCSHLAAGRSDCTLAGRTSIDLRDAVDDAKDRLTWKWSRGGATSEADLGTPASTSAYALCVYDRVAGASRHATGLRILPGAAWRRGGSGAWSYGDATGTADGVRTLRIRPGGAGTSRITLEAKGAALPMPAPVHPLRFFDVDPIVTVQLVNRETGRCWAAEFGPFHTRVNRGDGYRAVR